MLTNPLQDREEREARVFIPRPAVRQAIELVIPNRKTKNSDMPAVLSESQNNQILWNVWRGKTLDELQKEEEATDPLSERIDRT